MKTRISALMDGELEPHEELPALQSLRSTNASGREWQEFHLIGEALRGEENLEFDVTAKVMAALADEPTVLAPVPPARISRVSAWARPALALAASAAGVAVVAWVGLGSVTPAVDGATVARLAPQTKPVAEVQQVQASPRMQEYLVAHQTHGSGGSLMGGSHYVRTVSMAGERR